MSDERFKAIGMDDITMPGGWSVNDGQTFLYTPAERELMHQSRAFAQRELLPSAAAAHREVTEIKARHEGPARRGKLRAIAKAYLKQLGEAGLTGALFPEEYGGNGRGVVAECIIDEELAAAGHPGDIIRSVSLTLGTISILRYGTPEQMKRHIPARLRGEELAALAITEPQIAQRESAVTKLFVAESVWKIVDHAMQVLGGIGYTTDFPIQAIFRNARLMRIGAGSDEIMKFLVAREILKEIKG
jgi:alkylation response protein AidB-like acyl-CoA dehydrogenase